MLDDSEDVRRRDEEGDFHRLLPSTCPLCGCTVQVAEDDPSLLWEPGSAWDEECTDRGCRCHVEAVIGARRT